LIADQVRKALDKLKKSLKDDDFSPQWELLTVADIDYLNNLKASVQIKKNLVVQAIDTSKACEEIFESEVEEPDHSWA